MAPSLWCCLAYCSRLDSTDGGRPHCLFVYMPRDTIVRSEDGSIKYRFKIYSTCSKLGRHCSSEFWGCTQSMYKCFIFHAIRIVFLCVRAIVCRISPTMYECVKCTYIDLIRNRNPFNLAKNMSSSSMTCLLPNKHFHLIAFTVDQNF